VRHECQHADAVRRPAWGTQQLVVEGGRSSTPAWDTCVLHGSFCHAELRALSEPSAVSPLQFGTTDLQGAGIAVSSALCVCLYVMSCDVQLSQLASVNALALG